MNHTWVSVHLHYATQQETFFRAAISTLMTDFPEAYDMRRWFFIRYNGDAGPHFRLRFEVAETTQKEARLHALGFFEQYMLAHPSVLSADELTEWGQHWQPDNSVVLADYKPEYGRYGGPEGVDIVASLFHLSSLFCYDMIEANTEKWSPGMAVICSLASQVMLVRAAGMERTDAAVFLEAQSRYWLPLAAIGPSNQDDLDAIWNVFDSTYNDQENEVQRIADGFWAEYAEDDTQNDEEEPPQGRLFFYVRQVMSDYIQSFLDGKVEPRDAAYKNPNFEHYSPALRELHNLIGDLIHLNFNRLGIPNEQEAYLTFLMGRALGTGKQ